MGSSAVFLPPIGVVKWSKAVVSRIPGWTSALPAVPGFREPGGLTEVSSQIPFHCGFFAHYHLIPAALNPPIGRGRRGDFGVGPLKTNCLGSSGHRLPRGEVGQGAGRRPGRRLRHWRLVGGPPPPGFPRKLPGNVLRGDKQRAGRGVLAWSFSWDPPPRSILCVQATQAGRQNTTRAHHDRTGGCDLLQVGSKLSGSLAGGSWWPTCL